MPGSKNLASAAQPASISRSALEAAHHCRKRGPIRLAALLAEAANGRYRSAIDLMRGFLPLPSKASVTAMCAAALLLSCGRSGAVDRFVAATGGVTTGQGTLAQPWTLRKALTASQAGDTVFLRGGIYADTIPAGANGVYMLGVSGTAGAPITFKAYQGEVPVLDGTAAGATIPDNRDSYALLWIESRGYVVFRDLEIRNFRTTNRSDAMGIIVRGTAHHVEIRNCRVHHIETALASEDGPEGVANGIGVYGTHAVTPISSIIIDACEIHSLKTGWSESLVCNGNVDTFEITNNHIHDCNNIGIDCIGWEGTSSGALDYARNGIIRGNTVTNIDSQFNPAYGAEGATPGERSAPGIYVDGGAGILIERNRISSCNFGVSLGSEHSGRQTANCTLRDNLIWHCHIGGLVLGGSGGSNGGASGNVIRHNSFFQNDTSPKANSQLGEITLQLNLTGNAITHNIFHPSAKNIHITNWVATAGSSGNVIDRNLYYSTGGAAASNWAWNEEYVEGFSTWRSATGFDAHSLFANPQFVNAGGSPPDFHLLAASPARNAGDPAFSPAAGELDAHSLPRLLESRVDIGGSEYPAPTVTISSTDSVAGEWGPDTGQWTLTRTGSTAAALVVTVAVSGSATNGVDFASLGTTLTFPVNAAAVTLTVTPVLDALVEGTENVVVTLSPSPTGAYVAGSAASAAVSIADRPVDQWRKDQFDADAGNPEIAGDRADPDRDGVENLMEYALGSPPKSASGTIPPVTAIESDHLTITSVKNPAAIDLTFSARVGPEPGPWLTGPAHVTVLTNTGVAFKARDNAAASAAPRRFIQMMVTK